MADKIDVKQFVESRYYPKIKDICKGFGAYAEQYAKDNAPWEDRTSSARKSLTGFAILPGETVKISGQGEKAASFDVPAENEFGFGVAQGVEYGFHLETANDAKYAILEKSVNEYKDDFKCAVKEALAGSGMV